MSKCSVRGQLNPRAMCGFVIVGSGDCGTDQPCVHKVAPTITIYYWPDGTWCYASEYSEATYSFKGNDFGKMEVPDTLEDKDIDKLVDEAVS